MYHIASAQCLSDLERLVNTFMKEGWQPQGSILFSGVWVQPMLKIGTSGLLQTPNLSPNIES